MSGAIRSANDRAVLGMGVFSMDNKFTNYFINNAQHI